MPDEPVTLDEIQFHLKEQDQRSKEQDRKFVELDKQFASIQRSLDIVYNDRDLIQEVQLSIDKLYKLMMSSDRSNKALSEDLKQTVETTGEEVKTAVEDKTDEVKEQVKDEVKEVKQILPNKVVTSLQKSFIKEKGELKGKSWLKRLTTFITFGKVK